MKVLIGAYRVYPILGGVERFVFIAAEELRKRNISVKIVTFYPPPRKEKFSFEIINGRNPIRLWRALKWCNIFWQNNVSLKISWPLLFNRKIWIITHHTYLKTNEFRTNIGYFIKRYIMRFAYNISVSETVMKTLPRESTVIPACYDNELFVPLAGIYRNNDVVFVGRLEAEKGVDILLKAIAVIKNRGYKIRVTIVGNGKEREKLLSLVRILNISDMVSFAGIKNGIELVRILNSHKLMVIPSQYDEPFGLVALEGYACGCLVIGANTGGLKDIVEKIGVLFPKNDCNILAEKIIEFLYGKRKLKTFDNKHSFLKRFSKDVIIEKYLDIFRKLCYDSC